MFRLSYSLNSAAMLPIEEVCESLAKFGYSGVELSFQHEQFDPATITAARTEELRKYFQSAAIKPVCISTATTKFLSNVPHEPSLINVKAENRALRSQLIAQGIALAEKIGVPLVSFQSGYLRDEHARQSRAETLKTLAAEITELVGKIRGDVNLVLEPEPGMFIETIADARELIALVDNPRFGLHMDIGHVFCSEENYVEAIRLAAGEARYVHMADIQEGFNLKYRTAMADELETLLRQDATSETAVLYDIGDSGLYLFAHGCRKILVGQRDVLQIAAKYTGASEYLPMDKAWLAERSTVDLQCEIQAYLDSISGADYARVLRAYDAVATLRLGGPGKAAAIAGTVCNTVKGKVHYHDLFGNGKIDYAKVVSALIEGGYNGYCTVELYNHASLWRDIAPRSAKFILSEAVARHGWDSAEFGHIDHRAVKAPYLRVADAQMGPEGGVAVLYDLRLSQPNAEILPADALHSLEHCFLWLLPDLLPGFLGVGPMGCQTGLYLTTAYPVGRPLMTKAVVSALKRITQLDEVPYHSEALCGMAKNHDLAGAKAVAHKVVAALAG